MAFCRKCKTSKPSDEFTPSQLTKRNMKKGLRWCRQCVAQYGRERRAARPNHFRKIERQSQAKICQTAKGRSRTLLYKARERAKAKGLEFTLSHEWVEERVAYGYCEVTGIRFSFKRPKGDRSTRRSLCRINTPSLDRIDPKLGYTPDNCQVVCWGYNQMKGEFTHETVIKLATYLLEAAGFTITKTG